MQINSNREISRTSTHNGAPAQHANPIQALRRSVISCLLWESEFYEDGQEIAERIATLIYQCSPTEVAALAIEARQKYHLRHVPLWVVRIMALAESNSTIKHPRIVANTLASVIQRADEIPEFLAMYWKDGKTPIAKQVKLGLAMALQKFDEYQLAKYDRDRKGVRLRDVLFLTHAKPSFVHEADEVTIAPGVVREAYKRGDTKRHLRGQGQIWYRLAQQKLKTPDTWEVALSGGADKRATFERLIQEGKLGYLALLRNLRNMVEAGCDAQLVREAIIARRGADRVLPFRFIAAARVMPHFEPELDEAMVATLATFDALPGRTLVLVDNSGSMYATMSSKSDLSRADAAAGVAILIRGICESVRVFAFSDCLIEVPVRKGMALRDAIRAATSHGCTRLGRAVGVMNEQFYDRLIVITDEQSDDAVPPPKGRGYMINVASAKHGVSYRQWVHIDGFSEHVVRFIQEYEAEHPINS